MRAILCVTLALFAAPSFAQIATAGSSAGATAGAGAVAAGNRTDVAVPVTIQNPPTPTRTEADVRNVPGMGGMGGWAYAAPSGPCLGPSETKQGGAQAVWAFAGIGAQAGYGQSNLDWGCVIGRELVIAQTLCASGTTKACADRDKLYEMLPGISAVRAGSLPEYAKAQVVPAPQPTQQPAASQRTAAVAVRQPTNCVSDEFIARRTGATVCK